MYLHQPKLVRYMRGLRFAILLELFHAAKTLHTISQFEWIVCNTSFMFLFGYTAVEWWSMCHVWNFSLCKEVFPFLQGWDPWRYTEILPALNLRLHGQRRHVFALRRWMGQTRRTSSVSRFARTWQIRWHADLHPWLVGAQGTGHLPNSQRLRRYVVCWVTFWMHTVLHISWVCMTAVRELHVISVKVGF